MGPCLLYRSHFYSGKYNAVNAVDRVYHRTMIYDHPASSARPPSNQFVNSLWSNLVCSAVLVQQMLRRIDGVL